MGQNKMAILFSQHFLHDFVRFRSLSRGVVQRLASHFPTRILKKLKKKFRTNLEGSSRSSCSQLHAIQHFVGYFCTKKPFVFMSSTRKKFLVSLHLSSSKQLSLVLVSRDVSNEAAPNNLDGLGSDPWTLNNTWKRD